MTTRRRLLVIGLPFVLMVLGLWMLWPRSSTITRENAGRIQKGMTLAEVEALLGGPARDDSTGPVVRDNDDPRRDPIVWPAHLFNPNSRLPVQWQSDEVTITVAFNPEAQVTGSGFLPLRRADESLLDKIRRWLRL